MSLYQHILVAVDLSEESGELARRASELARDLGARLSLVHALEPFSIAYGGEIPMDLSPVQDQLTDHARRRLAKIAAGLDVPEAQTHAVTGHPQTEIRRTAAETGADLIVIGAHHHHWFNTLFGSTTDDIVHSASCDVLTIHIEA